MKRFLTISLLLLCCLVNVHAINGQPLVVNYVAKEYGAHNRNFDVLTDEQGRVYVANFEGLLYFDQAKWRIIHAPGICRITKLYRDSRGVIWVGGYGVFGKLESDENGVLRLKTYFAHGKNKGFLGEVADIYEENEKICVELSVDGVYYEDQTMKGIKVIKHQTKTPEFYKGTVINKKHVFADGRKLLATAGQGVVLLDKAGSVLFQLTEQNGLCNNNVNGIYVTDGGQVWGATDGGLFHIEIALPFYKYKSSEGLEGQVQTILKANGDIYVGTLLGLFRNKGNYFEKVPGVNQVCWQLEKAKDGSILACTAVGLFKVKGMKAVKLTETHTLSVFDRGDGMYYTGEVDGLYLSGQGHHRLLCNIEKNTDFYQDCNGILWGRNIFGQLFQFDKSVTAWRLPLFSANKVGEREKMTSQYNTLDYDHTRQMFYNSIYVDGGEMYVYTRKGLFKWDGKHGEMVFLNKFDVHMDESKYPLLIYPGKEGLWQTDNVGKGLHVVMEDNKESAVNASLYCVRDMVVRTLMIDGDNVWLGSDDGLMCWERSAGSKRWRVKPQLSVRQIVLNGDSIIWGGFAKGNMSAILPKTSFSLEPGCRSVSVSYSVNSFAVLGNAMYSYQVNDGEWSEWSTETSYVFNNPRWGSYKLRVRARGVNGMISDVLTVSFNIAYPIYLRWYAVLLYVVTLVLLVIFIVKRRTQHLLEDKLKLEKIVEDRTSQIRQQKDEMEEKSKNLETALEDLSKAQYQLVRQEKMATVGNLTHGLVDRILNPMNYINNFSHLSIGLAGDIRANLEDEKERMDEDNYEDSMDVIDMMEENLRKIEAHGLNTTRMLKAMEEITRDHSEKMQVVDFAAICRKNLEMVSKYFEEDFKSCHIQVKQFSADLVFMVCMQPVLISKAVMSIFNNAIYAIKKKYTNMPYEEPMLTVELQATEDGQSAVLTIRDNGIGIEKTIIDKIWDPFFTTKPTGDAAGVGMYLTREAVLNHGGKISVESVKDQYTVFTIVLPISHEE